jgi:hypothetical protein
LGTNAEEPKGSRCGDHRELLELAVELADLPVELMPVSISFRRF